MKSRTLLLTFIVCFATSVLWVDDSVRAGSNNDLSKESRHPLAMIKANVYVGQRTTTLELLTFAEDLEFFHGVEPNENGTYDSAELKKAIKTHADYLAERISVRDEDGELIEPELAEIIEFDFPEGGISSGTLMEYKLAYIFEYKHDEPPKFLTFQQDVVDDDFLFPAEVDFSLKQSGTSVEYVTKLKAGELETVRFDWDQPPLSKDASEKERLQWAEDRNNETLGINSYSSVYSFIYITDYEVRHEVLVPLACLATLIDFEREEKAFLTIAEQEKAAEQLKEFFGVGNPVKIDGIEVTPVFDRIDFYGLDLRDFAMQAEKRKVSMASGRAGLILSYKTKGTPDKVEVTWDKFSPVITTVEAAVIAFDVVDRHQFSKYLEDNTYVWQNPGRPPIEEIDPVIFEPGFMRVSALSLGCVAVIGLLLLSRLFFANGLVTVMILGAVSLGVGIVALPYTQFEIPIESTANVPDEQAQAIFGRLHRNMFRAFDYYDEEDSYDALARSVDGPLLRKTYLDFRKSLEVKEQGGAVSNINEVNMIEGEVVEPLADSDLKSGFAYKCKWNLIGTIEHWGHIHQRTNEYVALFNVESRDGEWKITAMDVLDQIQGPVKTEPRKR